MMQQVDILKIREKITSGHKQFMDELGCHSDRVLAEHNLTLELAFTRISFICDSFVELDVVDKKVEVRGDSPARKVLLSKTGYDNYVCISTNGDRIVIDGDSYLTSMDDFRKDKISLYGANTEEFDWTAFADQLLTVIHGIIYARKEAVANKMFGGFIKRG